MNGYGFSRSGKDDIIMMIMRARYQVLPNDKGDQAVDD